ncbi:MAG: hypothetical protein ACYTEQ_03455 [Planctomycetota bacterium]|jgi:hypothetical protein
MKLDMTEVRRQAQEEYQQELFKAAVESQKQKLRERRSFWDRIFPFRIVIVRKEAAVQ